MTLHCAPILNPVPVVVPEEYTLGKCLRTSSRSEVYTAAREVDARAVVLKWYIDDADDEGESRAKQEFEALRRAAGPGIVGALELVRYEGGTLLVLDRAPGVTLRAWVAAGLPPAAAFLDVAMQLASALACVHAARLIHRDIHPDNVLVDPAGLHTHLIDFGLARPLGTRASGGEVPSSSQELAGTLAYIAPEQTGRMGRGVDFRSDLYSLGATLYFLLTGRPPFEGDDPLALIHAHIAKQPVPPLDLRPGVPPTLSRIVMRLLQKSPEARYQTAHALHHDLAQCHEQLQSSHAIADDFALGTADAPYRPLFSKRLHGREAELLALHAAYARAAAGNPTFVMLGGPPGMGKSALVQELRGSLIHGGYLAQGKFDLYQRDLPHLGFIQAFQSFAEQLLTESDAQLARWRAEILEGVGAIARVLSDFVPELALVLGDLPPLPLLGPRETRARLFLAVQRFLEAAATSQHPLVLVLDDLQWADAGSRELLRELALASSGRALLVLGAYRDTEVRPGHPLAVLIAELERLGIPIQSLPVSPLSEDACAQMLAEALGRTPEATRPLAGLMARKTGNTPLLIEHLIDHLYAQGLIHFEPSVGWTWEDAAVAAIDIPDDAVGLMTAKIGRLDAGNIEVLQLASCVGRAFDVKTLAEVSDHARADLETALFELCDQGLITPSPHGFRFAHDRIREAAQLLLRESARRALHYRIAKRLLEQTEEAELETRVFEIADHLESCRERIVEGDRIPAIQIYKRAGARALGVGAATTAARYLKAGRELLRESDWTTDAALPFEVLLAGAEAAYQSRDSDTAVGLLREIERHPISVIQRGQVRAKLVTVYTLTRPNDETVELILDTLGELGLHVPASPSLLRTRLDIALTGLFLRGELGRVFRQARRVPPHKLATALVVAAGGTALALRSSRLPCLTIGFLIRTYRRHGYAAPPGLAIAGYAVFRLAVLGNPRGISKLRAAAEEWDERAPHPTYGPRIRYLLPAFLDPWLGPRRRVLERLRRVADELLEAGDLEYSRVARLMRANHSALVGIPLPEVLAQFNPLMDIASDSRPGERQIVRRSLTVLSGETALDLGHATDELLALLNEDGGWYVHEAGRWLGALYLLGEHSLAHRFAESVASPLYGTLSSSSHIVDYTFFRGLAAVACLRNPPFATTVGRAAKAARKKLRLWARFNGDFVHMAELLDADILAGRGRATQALARYESSARRAQTLGYIQHAALACERRAGLLRVLNRDTQSTQELQRALSLYEQWGAHAKVARIRLELSR